MAFNAKLFITFVFLFLNLMSQVFGQLSTMTVHKLESQLASGAGKGVSSDFGGTGADGFGK
uniref:Putative secreted salivary protein n=1 Tax=Xenopsylla cheopis TaxID=163159 RepID=A2IAB0_XENCH|nr:putative secreted salivary protein [Xenopsylla cheopis]